MKTNQLEDALSDCLELMQAGVPLNDCLARYPALAGDLRDRLTVARALESAPLAPLDPGAQARGRARLIGAVAQVGADGAATWRAAGPLAFAGSALRRFVAVPYALPAVLAMLILGGAAWGVSAATGNANPGDWLAGSASDDEREEYRGTIIAIGAASITITTTAGDVTALITPDTEFEDLDDRPLSPAEFALGDVVKLSAFRGPDGELIAREIEREADALDDDDRSPDDDDNRGPGNTNDDDDDADDDGSGPGDDDSGEDDDDAGADDD